MGGNGKDDAMAATRDTRPGDDLDDGRDETPSERYDRNWIEVLQELRVLQTGTQILTGFLLALAFQPAFADLERGGAHVLPDPRGALGTQLDHGAGARLAAPRAVPAEGEGERRRVRARRPHRLPRHGLAAPRRRRGLRLRRGRRRRRGLGGRRSSSAS